MTEYLFNTATMLLNFQLKIIFYSYFYCVDVLITLLEVVGDQFSVQGRHA